MNIYLKYSKHSQLKALVDSVLLSEGHPLYQEIRKGSSSGTNYLNIIFASQREREEARKLLQPLFADELGNCQPRYGIGIIVWPFFVY